MRILVVNDGLEHGSLSVPRLAYQLARHLLLKGHDVALLGTVRNRSEQGEGRIDGLRIFRIHTDYPLRFRGHRGLYNRDTVAKFRAIVSRLRPDIVHFHNVHTFVSFYCLKVARQLGARVFLTAHDVMLFWGGKLACFDENTEPDDVTGGRIDYRYRWWRGLRDQRLRYLPLRNLVVRRLVTSQVERLISVSDCLRRALVSNGYEHVTAVHNGVAADDLTATREEVDAFRECFGLGERKVILAGGRLSYLKGIEHLLRASASLRRDDFKIVIAGRGTRSYDERLRRQASELGLDGRVVLTGWIDERVLRGAFGAANVCVNPSLCFETLSMFNLEAMMARKPVVTSFFGGSSETILDGHSGHFVNPYRVPQLASRLSELLDAPVEAAEMGERGRERAEQEFEAVAQMEKVRALYGN
jgi:glycosyltransferase involved in cell wall biosynthesis